MSKTLLLPLVMVLLPAIVAGKQEHAIALVSVKHHVCCSSAEYCSQLGAVRVVYNDVAGNNTVEPCWDHEWLLACGTQWDCRQARLVCTEIMKVDNLSEMMQNNC